MKQMNLSKGKPGGFVKKGKPGNFKSGPTAGAKRPVAKRPVAPVEETPREEWVITITDVAYLGSGVGRHDGCVVFVPGTCLGEEVRVRVVRRKKKFVTAKVVEVIKPAPERLAEKCCYAPGVTYAHMSYEGEVATKQRQLESFLTRMAGIDPAGILLPPVASPKDLHYRNKIVLHAGEQAGYRTLGYLGQDNETVQDMPQCPLAAEPINEELDRLRSDDKFMNRLCTGDKVTFRYTPADGVAHWFNQEIPNRYLTEETAAGPMMVHMGGFFQINLAAANLMLETFMARFAKPDVPKHRVIDLYCGAGFFSAAAAKAGAHFVVGIEQNSGSVASARKNAAPDALAFKSSYMCADAGTVDPAALRHDPEELITMIVDPPREGLEPQALGLICDVKPQKLFYISCGPDTLMRDLKPLVAAGYKVEAVQLFDLFPRTPHFETFVELTLEG